MVRHKMAGGPDGHTLCIISVIVDSMHTLFPAACRVFRLAVASVANSTSLLMHYGARGNHPAEKGGGIFEHCRVAAPLFTFESHCCNFSVDVNAHIGAAIREPTLLLLSCTAVVLEKALPYSCAGAAVFFGTHVRSQLHRRTGVPKIKICSFENSVTCSGAVL